MKAYAVLISYPTYDEDGRLGRPGSHRGQRGFRVLARSEKEARATALRQSPQGSRIVAAQLSRRQPEVTA